MEVEEPKLLEGSAPAATSSARKNRKIIINGRESSVSFSSLLLSTWSFSGSAVYSQGSFCIISRLRAC